MFDREIDNYLEVDGRCYMHCETVLGFGMYIKNDNECL